MFVQSLFLLTIFLLGFSGRHFRIFLESDNRTLVNIVIYLTMPAVTFSAIVDFEIGYKQLIILPLVSCIIVVILFLIATLVVRLANLPPATQAVFLCSATVSNLGYFLYPFFTVIYGKEGLASLVTYDIGNTFIAYTLTYYIALSYSKTQDFGIAKNAQKILVFPPFLAIVVGILYVLIRTNYHVPIPSAIRDSIHNRWRLQFFSRNASTWNKL